MYLLQPALSYHRFQMVTIISSLPQQNMVEIRPGGSPEGRLGSMKIPKNEVVVLPRMENFWKWPSNFFFFDRMIANVWEVFSVNTRPTWGLVACGPPWENWHPGKRHRKRQNMGWAELRIHRCFSSIFVFGGWSPIEPSKLPLLSIVHWSWLIILGAITTWVIGDQ